MTKPPSLSHVGAGNSSFHSHTLLTPPLSPASSEDVPYKPDDDDVTSLSMKRRHCVPHSRERRRLNRACASSTELRDSSTTYDDFTTTTIQHAKSLSHLATSSGLPMSKTARTPQRDRSNIRKRRWTLPSKGQPAQGFMHKVSAEIRPPETADNADNPSPAMITLRRASIARPANRKTSLTFFPPPKFERAGSGLLTAFLNTLTGDNSPSVFRQRTQSISSDRRSSTTAVEDPASQQTRKASAAPVFTKVTGIAPELLLPRKQSQEGNEVRRCSTQYISSGSVYEVIWDENVSSSGSEATPPAPVPDGRRQSLAMDKLETQLFRAVAQSRRASLASGGSPESRVRETGSTP